MKQQLRVNFLNWRPDQDAFGNDGLIVADDCLHDSEGYKELRYQSAGAFTTTTSMGVHVIDMVARPLLNANKLALAVITDVSGSGTTAALAIGILDDELSYTSISTSTLSSIGSVKLLSFSATELENRAVITAQAEAQAQGGTAISLNLSAVGSYTLISA
jgi:hypothetical protein